MYVFATIYIIGLTQKQVVGDITMAPRSAPIRWIALL